MNRPHSGIVGRSELMASINQCHSLALHNLLPRRCKLALDANCGLGNSTQVVSRVSDRVIGIDHCSRAIAHAKSRQLGEKFEFASVPLLEFEAPPTSFDLISMNCPSSLVQRSSFMTCVQRKIVRLLKPDGCFCLVLKDDRSALPDDCFARQGTHANGTTRSTMALLRVLRRCFDLSLWDVKSTIVNEFRLENLDSEPPFEVVTGRLRSFDPIGDSQ